MPGLDDWTLAYSDTDSGIFNPGSFTRYERFNGLTAPISVVRFWGLHFSYSTTATVPWQTCPANYGFFAITFYADQSGQPGEVVYRRTLDSNGRVVGRVGYPLHDLHEYSAVLDSPVALREGWVSIVGYGAATCSFTWMSSDQGDGMSLVYSQAYSQTAWTTETFDLALCLTTDGVAAYGACCDDATESCQENVAMNDCQGRFLPGGTCASFSPSCGTAEGVCCSELGTCTTTTARECGGVPFCRGDVNCDGEIDYNDIGPFLLALGNPAEYPAVHPDCHVENSDCNGDDVTSFADINPFVRLLGTACERKWLGPGGTCDQCPLVRLTVPAELPAERVGTTCGRTNVYDSTCLSPYDSGPDIIYELVVTAATDVHVSLDPNGTTYAGLLLTNTFPPGQDCIATSVAAVGSPDLGCHHLAAGTYYILVDSWSLPACMSTYTLHVTPCEPAPGRCCYGDPAQCAQLLQDECAALAGVWDPTLDCTTPCPTRFREDCAHAEIIQSTPFSVTYNSGAMTADGPAAPCDKYGPSGPMQNDAWWVWTAPNDCLATASISGGGSDRVLVVRRDCATETALYCADEDIPGTNSLETIRFPATAGTTYYFQGGTAGNHSKSGSGTFTLDCSGGSGACCFVGGSCQVLTGSACIGQGGGYIGDNSDCATVTCPQPTPGNICADPVLVTLNAASLPYVDHNTTQGRGNDYWNTCLGSYDNDADIVYKLTVAEPIVVNITLDPGLTPYTGFVLSNTCPPGDSYIVKNVHAGAGAYKIEYIVLAPGVYYFIVDSWLVPGGIPSFELRIEDADPQTGACCVESACTADVTLAQCLALSGNWFRGQACTESRCQTVAGNTCASPIAINMTGQVSVTRSDTTCGRGNAYAGTTCLGVFDGGQEIVYALNVIDGTKVVDIAPRGAFGERAAMVLSDMCPPTSACSVFHNAISGIVLAPGTHYLMVDMWPYRQEGAWVDCLGSSPITFSWRVAPAEASP